MWCFNSYYGYNFKSQSTFLHVFPLHQFQIFVSQFQEFDRSVNIQVPLFDLQLLFFLQKGVNGFTQQFQRQDASQPTQQHLLAIELLPVLPVLEEVVDATETVRVHFVLVLLELDGVVEFWEIVVANDFIHFEEGLKILIGLFVHDPFLDDGNSFFHPFGRALHVRNELFVSPVCHILDGAKKFNQLIFCLHGLDLKLIFYLTFLYPWPASVLGGSVKNLVIEEWSLWKLPGVGLLAVIVKCRIRVVQLVTSQLPASELLPCLFRLLLQSWLI